MKIARSVRLLRFGGVLTFGRSLGSLSVLLGYAFAVGGVAGYASVRLQIIVDWSERAEEKAADIGEGAGATWGDPSLRAKSIDRAKRAIDAVRILKVVRLVG